MATAYDYFTTDGVGKGVVSQLVPYLKAPQLEFNIPALVHRNYGVGATYIAYFVPHVNSILPVLRGLLAPQTITGVLDYAYGLNIGSLAYPGERAVGNSRLPFSNRICVYSEDGISEEDWSVLSNIAQQLGLFLSFRGPEWVRIRSDGEEPLGFLSHDSRDKADIARPLAVWLKEKGALVWFDEFSIPIGASIAASVDKGLVKSTKVILLVTPNYLENLTWASAELNAMLNEDITSGGGRLIPVWWNVTREAVAARSVLLADRRALVSAGNLETIGAQIFHQLTGAYVVRRELAFPQSGSAAATER